MEKMVHVVINLVEQIDDFSIFRGFDSNVPENERYKIYTDISEIENRADAIIDFSFPQATLKILDYTLSKNVPMVIITTGLTDEKTN